MSWGWFFFCLYWAMQNYRSPCSFFGSIVDTNSDDHDHNDCCSNTDADCGAGAEPRGVVHHNRRVLDGCTVGASTGSHDAPAVRRVRCVVNSRDAWILQSIGLGSVLGAE